MILFFVCYQQVWYILLSLLSAKRGKESLVAMIVNSTHRCFHLPHWTLFQGRLDWHLTLFSCTTIYTLNHFFTFQCIIYYFTVFYLALIFCASICVLFFFVCLFCKALCVLNEKCSINKVYDIVIITLFLFILVAQYWLHNSLYILA